MVSRSATILALALPLGLCLAACALAVVILQRRLRHRERRDLEKSDLFTGKLEDLHNLYPSYRKNIFRDDSPLSLFIKKWLQSDPEQRSTTSPETIASEVARLEPILFHPWTDLPQPVVKIDRDLSIFPNPHHYTATEIVVALNSEHRGDMARHIMTSILLKNASVEGNPKRTLLAFEMEELDGLYNLQQAILHGLDLAGRLLLHISRFGPQAQELPYISRGPPMDIRNIYHYADLFEDIFKPYFHLNVNSGIDESYRRSDILEEVLPAATSHGMNSLTYARAGRQIFYDWGERSDPRIETKPIMKLRFRNPDGDIKEEEIRMGIE